MHNRIYPLVGASAVALVAAAAFAPAATAHNNGPSGVSASHKSSTTAVKVQPQKRGNCYSSLMNSAGDAVVSQNFTDAGFDAYDSMGADNFSVKKTCKVTGVFVPGEYFGGSGPADSETVTFYADAGGEPGAVVDSQTVTGTDDAGTFTIPLATVALKPGSYWVSVQATMSYAAGGEWGWETTLNLKNDRQGQWENPADGFMTGCTTWTDVTTCIEGSGPDFSIRLTK